MHQIDSWTKASEAYKTWLSSFGKNMDKLIKEDPNYWKSFLYIIKNDGAPLLLDISFVDLGENDEY